MAKFHWLTLRVKAPKENGKPFSLRLPPISIHTLRGAVISCDGLLSLIGGGAGIKARAVGDAIQGALTVMQREGFMVNVDADKVSVHIHMV